MNARPRKVEVVVLGRGLAAAALGDQLAASGKRVALLVEEPGWESGARAAWQEWHLAPETEPLAAAGSARFQAWHEAGLPGLQPPSDERGPYWRVALGTLLPALGERIAATEKCFVAVGTRVRGISVIENGILGAIAEDARYDARVVVNAAEDERFAAFARMMRHPGTLDLQVVPPEYEATANEPYLRDRGVPRAEPLPVSGGWQIRGVAGWPLLAVGAALHLADRLAEG